MTPLRAHGERIRRRAWLVLVITLIAVAGSVWSSLSEGTTYTARATLGISSTGRSPDQDAVLASGYIDVFNDASYLSQIRDKTDAPAGVTLAASTAAASPIIYIQASGKDAAAVGRIAPVAAAAFRDDINSGLVRDRNTQVAAIQQQIDKQRAILDAPGASAVATTLATQSITDLQGRINDIMSNSDNQLQDVQLVSGVSAASSGLVMSAGLALVGGLILGCLAALGVAYGRNRIETESDIRDRLDATPLVTIGGGRSKQAERDRIQQYKRLSNLVAAASGKHPTVVAVVSARRSTAATDVATAVARFRAAQGERTLLVETDPLVSSVDNAALPGVVDVLATASPADLAATVVAGGVGEPDRLPAGCSELDPFDVYTAPRWKALLDAAVSRADVVVVASVSLLDAAEAQTICGSADVTVLVVESEQTRLSDARTALDLLAQVEVEPLGVVTVGQRRTADQPGGLPVADGSAATGASGAVPVDIHPIANHPVANGDGTGTNGSSNGRTASDRTVANGDAHLGFGVEETVRIVATRPSPEAGDARPTGNGTDAAARSTQPEDAGARR